MSRRWRQTMVFPVLLVVAAAYLAPAEADEAKSATKASGKAFVVWPADGLEWKALPDAPPGPMIAVISGDPGKGAYTGIEKFPAGFSAPLHTHVSDHKVVVISGTWIHSEEGKPEVRLGPGSYLFQPANQKHTTACDSASECVFFIESSGKMSIKMVEEKKAPAGE
jgi:quercetin dioxygenase-like cupin family protein